MPEFDGEACTLSLIDITPEQNERLERSLGPIGKLEPTVDALLASMGFVLVRVLLMGKERPTLQIMAERLDGMAMGAEDCAHISRALSPLLENEDPIKEAYTLEVSSPGIDRPLTRAYDFARFAGHKVKIEAKYDIDGQRRFSGTITGVSLDALGQASVVLDVVETMGARDPLRLPIGDLAKSKLTMTDALLDAAQANEFTPPMAPDGSVAPWPPASIEQQNHKPNELDEHIQDQ